VTDSHPSRHHGRQAPQTPEQAVRAYFAAYNSGDGSRFDTCVSPSYVDYGHTPPGHGPQGARDDLEHAKTVVGGIAQYSIDAIVVREDTVAVAWTGTLPGGKQARGLSLYRVVDGLVTEIRHAAIGGLPH
jgi:ketosteroid isomerase-like protein